MSKNVKKYPQIDFTYNNTFFTNCYHLQHLDVEKETEKQVIHFSCHLERFFTKDGASHHSFWQRMAKMNCPFVAEASSQNIFYVEFIKE